MRHARKPTKRAQRSGLTVAAPERFQHVFDPLQQPDPRRPVSATNESRSQTFARRDGRVVRVRHIVLTEELDESLVKYCEYAGRTVSSVIEAALNRYIYA